jgi:hypothetical protein
VIAPDLTEEFPELPGDDAAVDPPAARAAPEPATVDELQAAVARLESDNAAMKARIAQLEMPLAENWIELKRVARSPRPSDCEWLRRRCEAQKVEAEKRQGRWFINTNGPRLKACLNRR